MKRRGKKDKDSSFVAFPKNLVSITELQSMFFRSFGFVPVQGSFLYPLGHTCGGSDLCIISSSCLKLVSGSLPCTSFSYWHDSHHHHNWALLSGMIPETSLWGREVYYPHFRQGTEVLVAQNHKGHLAEQSLETGSQSLLLLCRGSATESSYSSLPLLNISTRIYFTNMKPSLGSIARSTCSFPWVLPPSSQTIHCGSHRLLDCMESGTSASQVCSCHSRAPAQTSNTNLHFLSWSRRYNCFLPPMPRGRLWSQGHSSSLCFGS